MIKQFDAPAIGGAQFRQGVQLDEYLIAELAKATTYTELMRVACMKVDARLLSVGGTLKKGEVRWSFQADVASNHVELRTLLQHIGLVARTRKSLKHSGHLVVVNVWDERRLAPIDPNVRRALETVLRDGFFGPDLGIQKSTAA